ERVDHRAVVGAVTGRLHDHVAGEAEMIAEREQLRLAGVAGGVFALGRIREPGPRPEHMAMRVDSPRGKRKARPAWAVEPVEPALRLLERSGHGPSGVFHGAFSRHI